MIRTAKVSHEGDIGRSFHKDDVMSRVVRFAFAAIAFCAAAISSSAKTTSEER